MQCPICKKDLEIKNKKIGENEAGEAIYNEFAICRDCKKQWNLDKQREKKKKLAKEAQLTEKYAALYNLLLIQKYRLIRRKNVLTRLPKAKDR